MVAWFERQVEAFMRWAQPFERFVRRYTEGLKTRDLQRMFQEESVAAYEVLTRDQEESPRDLSGFKLVLHRLKSVFLGLSFKLSPGRRLVFAGAVLAVLLGILPFDLVGGRGLPFDDAVFWFAVASAAFFFLFVLELVDRVRYRDEVEVARQLQRDLLPQALPEVPGYGFAFSYRTANDIGGDYYDFLELGDGRLGIVAGDASGHGIGAGLLMATAKSALLMAVEVERKPEKVAELMNRVLCKTGGSRDFMTLFFAVLDLTTGELEHVSAGHPYPLLRRPSGHVTELGTGALPLGIRSTIRLRSQRTQLAPGDLLLLFSDGLPEAIHPLSGQDFGYERVHHLLADGGSARAVHDRVTGELTRFLGDTSPMDDVSVVVVERLR